MQDNGKNWSYYTLSILATTLWGSAFAGAKIGFEYMPPMMLSGFRFMLAGVLLLPLIAIMKIDWRGQLSNWRFMLLFGLLQTFLQYGLFYAGLNLVPGALAAIIIGAGPLFTAIMAHLTLPNDKLNSRKVFAILLGVMGVVSISVGKGSHAAINPLFYRGMILLMVSNIVGSYTNIMVIKRTTPIAPILLTSFANFTGGLLLLVVSLFVEPTEVLTHGSLPMEFYLALLWLAIIPAAGFSIWYNLLQRPGVKVSELNVMKFIIPVVGVLLSWLLLPDESPSWSATIGIVIISASVIILQMPKRRPLQGGEISKIP
ncbi:MAG: DMT family transporter, partial [Rikenellaceae bacterium]